MSSKIAILCGFIAARAQNKSAIETLQGSINDAVADLNKECGFLTSTDNSWLDYMDNSRPDESPKQYWARIAMES